MHYPSKGSKELRTFKVEESINSESNEEELSAVATARKSMQMRNEVVLPANIASSLNALEK
jgi:hypothetical protein